MTIWLHILAVLGVFAIGCWLSYAVGYIAGRWKERLG